MQFVSVYLYLFLLISVYFCLFLFISVQPQTQPLLHIPAQVASTPASSACFRDYYNTKTCMNIFFQQGLCYDESGPARGAKVRKGIKGEALISAGARHGAKVRGREAPARARRARRQQGPPEERAKGSGRIKRARRAQKKQKPRHTVVTTHGPAAGLKTASDTSFIMLRRP